MINSTPRGAWAKFAIAVLMLVSSLALAGPASARAWKQGAKSKALEYSQILDDRGRGEIVLLWWLVPPLVENYPEGQAVLDKYVVVAVIHAHAQPDSTFIFDDVDQLAAMDAAGNALKGLADAEMPADVTAMLAGMKGAFVHALGPMGKGTHWFVFESGKAHACSKGRLTIPFAGEKYFYDTPIPGCPSA